MARCPHGHVCVVNGDHLLHPLTLDACDLEMETTS
jgi:hypothetical protein